MRQAAEMGDAMDVQEALNFIKGLAYKPNWRFEVEDHTNRFQNSITILIHYPAFNSNREQARKGYPEEIMTYAKFALDVTYLTEDTLYYVFIKQLMHIELHEAREFLRIPGQDYDAPFHPHRTQGMLRWIAAEAAVPFVGHDSDLRFGIA